MSSKHSDRSIILLIILALSFGIWFFRGDILAESMGTIWGDYAPDLPETLIQDEVTVYGIHYNKVKFSSYIPTPRPGERMPVLILIGGYLDNGLYYVDKSWSARADRDRFVLLAPAFTKEGGDFGKMQSYHYPSAWSGQALDRMLEELSAYEGVNSSEVYMYGFSAGAQVCHRYALMRPNIVKAVAPHAAGGYTFPTRKIATRFRVSVGEGDPRRLKLARKFVQKAQAQGIDAYLAVYPNLSHSQSALQLDDAMQFLINIRDM